MSEIISQDIDSFSLNSSPSHLLHRAQQVAANQSAQALRDAGVTLRQFSVLAAVAEIDGASQSDLVAVTGIDRSTLADMVQRMEKAGLIERTRSETDARAKAVALTGAGEHALATAKPAVQGADDALLAALPKARRGAFVDILTRLTGSVEPRTQAPAAAAPAKAEAPEKAKKSKKKAKDKKADKAKAPAKASAKAPAKATAKAKAAKKSGKKASKKKA